MYLRRRVIVGVAFVLVLALAAFCVVSLVRGAAAIVGQTTQVRPGITRSSVPSPSETSAVKDCGADDLSLQLTAASQTVAVGGSVDFTVTIVHEGSGSCLVDGSDSSRILTITSGNDTVWTSASCTSDSRMLLMAKGDKDTATITWNADRTGSSCEEDSALPRVDAGTYVAKVAMKGDASVSSPAVTVTVK